MRGILFDLDNTLMDFVKMKEMSCEAAVQAMIKTGLKTTKEEGLKVLYDMYEQMGWENQEIFAPFIKKFNGSVDYEMLASGIVAYRRAKTNLVMPYPNVPDVLNKLKKKGLKLGILSDAPRMQAWIRLVEMNIQKNFDIVVTLDDTGVKKPDQRPFMKAAETLGLRPEEILFVGDSVLRDVEGAKRAGMVAVLAKYGNFDAQKSKTKPDYMIDDIEELLKIVDKKG
jgi:HAD superfamily hydrolase (TIGR02253 family)